MPGKATVAALVLLPVLAAGCATGQTDPATYIDDTGATLNAHGDAGGDPTTYWFEFGTGTGYGLRTPDRAVAADFSGPISERLPGLAKGVTYHYRACARNVDGAGCGRDQAFTTGSPAGTAQYPDLITLAPGDLHYDTATIDGTKHDVLRFSNTAWNAGQGHLELIGTTVNSKTRVAQRVYNSDGGSTQTDIGEFVWHPSHNHWHFEGFAEYGLWTRAEYDAWLASGRKNGAARKRGVKTTFCIIDTRRVLALPGSPTSPRYTACGQTAQGMAIGWGDEYNSSLPDQWIDLGNARLADGAYVLRSVTDPDNRIIESPGKADASRESAIANEAVTFFTVTGNQIRVTG